MATSSIFHNVKLKNKNLCRGLVRALENAKADQGKEVVLSQRCQRVKADEIRAFLQQKGEEK